MKIKSILQSFVSILLASFLFTGCNPDEPTKPTGASVITIEQGDVTHNTVAVKFIPNDNTVSYKIAIGSADDLPRFEDGTLEGIETITTAGEKEQLFEGLLSETQYTVFAQGVNADDVKGEVATITVSTVASAGASVITIEQGDVTHNTIAVKFIPNDNTVSYKIAIGSAGDLPRFEDGTLEGIETITTAGEKEQLFEGLLSETQYTVFAQGVNADGESGAIFTVTITTVREVWVLSFEGAMGEYYGDIGWADNMDLTLYSGMEGNGSIVNGYKLFFEAFAPNAEDTNNPVIVPGTYNAATEIMPDEFEFAPGFDDGTGNIRSSQYVQYVNGQATKIAITGGSYTVTKSGDIYTVTIEVETTGLPIQCVYSGGIEIEDYSWMN